MKKVVVTDKSGKETGVAEFQDAIRDEMVRAIVRIFVFNSDGELFVQKRSDNSTIGPGLMNHSAGGHIDEGEAYEFASRRELEEELGIKDVPLVFLDERYFEESYGDMNLKSYEYLYICKYDGEIKLQEDEVQGGEWYSLDMLENLSSKNPEIFTKGLLSFVKDFDQYIKDFLNNS